MHTGQVLTLLLALSGALNVAFAAGFTARLAGIGARPGPGHSHRGRRRRRHHGLSCRCIRLPLTASHCTQRECPRIDRFTT